VRRVHSLLLINLGLLLLRVHFACVSWVNVFRIWISIRRPWSASWTVSDSDIGHFWKLDFRCWKSFRLFLLNAQLSLFHECSSAIVCTSVGTSTCNALVFDGIRLDDIWIVDGNCRVKVLSWLDCAFDCAHMLTHRRRWLFYPLTWIFDSAIQGLGLILKLNLWLIT